LRSELDHYLKEDVMPDIAQFDILDIFGKKISSTQGLG